jgi:hypothetical protein
MYAHQKNGSRILDIADLRQYIYALTGSPLEVNRIAKGLVERGVRNTGERNALGVVQAFAPIFAIRLVILPEMAFQPMPLSRRPAPFDHPEWVRLRK